MIKVLIELELTFPYKKSMIILSEFCHLWSCGLLEGGTNRANALISIASGNFKRIFGENPRVKKYKVPTGTEHFTKNWEVKKIHIKE